MEVLVDTENVKVPNAVIVSGLTDTESDQDVTDFLTRYGRITRTLRIDDPESPYHKNAIVEYESGRAMETLEPILPYEFESPSNVTYFVKALSSEYVPTVADSATQSFIAELQRIAKLSGRSFEDVLQLQLARSPALNQPPSTQPQEASPARTPVPAQATAPVEPQETSPAKTPVPAQTTVPAETPKRATEVKEHGQIKENEAPVTTVSFANPAEVQRVIVEHVVKSNAPASSAHASFRLRQFSGKVPCPSHEVDFDTWRNSVDLMLQDPALSDFQRSRKILDSLVPPAVHVVKPLGPQALPATYLELLDSAFETVQDGDELFAVFLNTFQNTGETPSQFLHRLQAALTKVLKRGGLLASDADRHLLRQFCRGCWDNALIADLQLERKKENPPSFTELLLQLRTEEDKQTAKETRMKKHLGTSKQRANVHLLAASSIENDISANDVTDLRNQIAQLQSQFTSQKGKTVEPQALPRDDEIAMLKKQVTQLRSQLTSRKPKKATNGAKSQVKPKAADCQPTTDTDSQPRPSNRPRPWYCFRCGEDNHIASTCENEPDPSLVAEKKNQLRDKQALWDSQNGPASPHHLNCSQLSSRDK